MAKEAGIDILDVTPTGADGIRVRARDVEAYLAAPRPAAECADSAESVITEIPWKGVRAAIAKNMYNSVQQTAQCTMACEVNATKLLTLRESLKQDQEMLEPFGIKVLVVTGWDNADLVNQIEAVGRIFDVEEKAAELRAFYEENQQKLDACLANVAEKKTVYWEYGDPYTTCIPGTSNDGWHNMLVSAGAINIFGDESLAGKDIDPEAILLADPDLIIKTSSGPALKNTGVYTPPTQEMYEEITAEMVSRPGWSDLKAVQNKNLYCTTGFCAGGLGKLIGALYTATWLYPDECADIDPDAVFDEWMSMQEVGPIEGHVYRLP